MINRNNHKKMMSNKNSIKLKSHLPINQKLLLRIRRQIQPKHQLKGKKIKSKEMQLEKVKPLKVEIQPNQLPPLQV